MTENKLNRRPCLIVAGGSWFVGSVLIALTAAAIAWSPAPLSAQDDEPEIPQPENVTLDTRDGLRLRFTYYPGTNGKKTVPIILLHGWGGRRGDFDSLATLLQKSGHAVIAPDLRGHGDSTRFNNGSSVKGLDRLRSPDLALMARFDVERIKKFLMEKNNKGELNIELLCLVAADASSTVALNWAAQDWSWPETTIGKQGKDVKALVLLSPQLTFRGYKADKALSHRLIRSQLSVMIVAGERNSKANSDAKRIHKILKRYHPDPPRSQALDKKDLFLDLAETDLQGTKLLDPRLKLKVDSRIARFIELRLVRKAGDFPWTSRP